MTASQARLVKIVAIVLGALLLSWPLFVNHGPFFMPDTSAYLRAADSGVTMVTGHKTEWSDRTDWYVGNPITTNPGGKLAQELQTPAATSSKALHPPLAGRSIYYGLAAYVPLILFGEGAVSLIQSLLLAILAWIVVRATLRFPDDPRQIVLPFAACCLMLALFTSAPFVTTLVMPDFLAGMALVAAVLLIIFARQFSRIEIAFLAALLIWGSMAHTSHFLILVALLPFAALLAWRGTSSALGVCVIGLAMALTVLGDKAYVETVRHVTGDTPVRPPFLSARLIDEGPGYAALKSACPHSQWVLCGYLSRMPRDSDAFLWSNAPADGVFSATPQAVQRQLSREDFPFALMTARKFPVAVAGCSLRAFAHQLMLFNLSLYRGIPPSPGVGAMWDNLPTPVAERMRQTRTAQGAMPVTWTERASPILIWASLAAACLFVLSGRGRPDPDGWRRRWLMALMLVAFGVLTNAAITGALSKPDARYNARIVWVIPLIAGAFLTQAMHRRPAGDSVQTASHEPTVVVGP